MSHEEYVQLEAVRVALEKVVKDENAIEKVLNLLSEATVTVDETNTKETPESADSAGNEKDETPKVKQQYVIVVSDPNKEIKKEHVGWVLQIPEDKDISSVLDGLKKAAYNYNASKKGNKYPVSSIGQALESVSGKFFKAYDIKLKTKESVYVVVTDNTLPKN
jgi:hypothetical protein